MYIYTTIDNVGDSVIYIWQRRFLKSKQSKESHQSDEKADGNDFLRSLFESEGPLVNASTNNYATTVLAGFLGAVSRYGLPSRVRLVKLLSQYIYQGI